MTTTNTPNRCTFCGRYLTIDKKYTGQRCLDPAHWQATRQLAPRDFYMMARLMAEVGAELAWRPIKTVLPGQVYG